MTGYRRQRNKPLAGIVTAQRAHFERRSTDANKPAEMIAVAADPNLAARAAQEGCCATIVSLADRVPGQAAGDRLTIT
ncbi:MAG: hypothetical protein WAN20_03520 [Pseudonocardiaceae bacterium]